MSTAPHYGLEIASVAARRAMALRLVFGFLAGATDAAAIVLLSIGTGILYHRVLYGDAGIVTNYVQVGLLTAWLYAIVNIYRSEYSVLTYLEFKRHPKRIARFWTLTFVGLIALAFLTKTTNVHSRGWLILFYVAGFPTLILVHALLVRAVVAGSEVGLIATKRLFLVGAEADIRDFIRRYRVWDLGLEIVGTAHLHRPSGDWTADGERRFADDLKAAVAGARALELDGVFVIVPWHERETIDRCVEAFMTVPTSIYLAPERLLDRFESVAIEQIGAIASLHLLRPPLSLGSVLVKRLFDLAVSALGLIVLSPLFLAVALAIKLDSAGPVFFLQRRYGFNQKPFRILKFRTMTTLEDGAAVRQAERNDARVTRVGQMLRRWNIDELPQLANVLAGHMSLVGPRPHALVHDETWGKSIALYARRHNVKPGITGWAQIHGFRGNIDSDDQLQSRIEYDLYYIDNWSLWLDLRILFATVFFPKAYENAF
jgi:Undecaprenyl-phosphate glucose phosphotransferase